jgi:tungstate transport system substrate-binding protein
MLSFSGLLRFARTDETQKPVIARRRRDNPGDRAGRLLLNLLPLLAVLSPSPSAHAEQDFITLASTTSTEQSGLFAHLLPAFTAKTGIAVHVVAVGTGQALKIGERGDADVLLVHDKPSELKFIAEGWGIDRHDVMYNDFIIVGPERDPAKIAGGTDAVAAFRKIATANTPFVSRGDDSGTDKEEKRLWQDAGIDIKQAGGGWYREVGSGMGPTLNIAAALDAYTLSDRGTWLSFSNRRDLRLLVAGDKRLFNQYGVMLVNPARHATVKVEPGKAFIDWLVSPEGQQTIASYKIGGEQLFFPDAQQ